MKQKKKDIYALLAVVNNNNAPVDLSGHARLLYRVLIDVCNSNYWAESFQVSNADLMKWMGIRSEHTIIKSRNELIQHGMICCHIGKKNGTPNTYSLTGATPANNAVVPLQNIHGVNEKTETIPLNEIHTPTAQNTNPVCAEYIPPLHEIHTPTANDAGGEAGNPLQAGDTSHRILNTINTNNTNNTIDVENEFSTHPKDDIPDVLEEPKKGKKGNPANPKKPPAHPAYSLMVAHWKTVVHPDWDFGGMQGKAIKELIKKIESRMKTDEAEPTPEQVTAMFAFICEHLPDWFKDKDLQTINSKFNEIIEKIKNKSNGTNASGKSIDRYADAENYFK